MMVRVPNCGSVGLNKDLSQHELPINAWTDADNIRFLDGYCYQFYGHKAVYDTPSVLPYHVLPVRSGLVDYWIYAGSQKIYATTISGGVGVHTNLTRQTAGVDVNYTGVVNEWTSTVLGGIPILNSSNDAPQQWDLNIANRMTDLSNWPANTTCKSMRAYKNFLVALNVTKSGTNYPYMVKWSQPAVPGAVPSSWDETDPTKDAGEVDLAEGYDKIVDGLQLRDSFIIYKEASVWRMDYTGGSAVFRFSKVLGTSGAMNRNCIVEVDGFHVVLTGADIIAHDGQTASSLLDKQTRRWLFQNIETTRTSECFVFKNTFMNEVYICFPSIGASAPDKAIVWNIKDKTISIRDLPSVHHANIGPVDTSISSTWGSDADPWDADLTAWNGPDYISDKFRVVMASEGPNLFMLDASASFNGQIPSAYLERIGLSIAKPETIKLIRSVRPRITGNVGDTVIVKIGSQNDPYETPTYTTMTHTIGTTVSNDCLVSGRYIAVRFETGTAYNWRLDSYDLDVEEIGLW